MKIKLVIVALFTTFVLNAQLNISTNYRQDALWDEIALDWEVYSTDDTGTLFEFNKELTMFKHTTERISSTYYITSWEYDEDKTLYTMQVKSDVGNEYEMMIDGINNCVCFFKWYDEGYVLVRHTIKSSWITD